MSIPKVKIAVLKNLLIFDEKYRPQSENDQNQTNTMGL